MPVLVDRGAAGQMLLGAGPGARITDFPLPARIDVALVNNMPDSALLSTESQFADLLSAASGDLLVRLRPVAMPGIPRGDEAQRLVSSTYSTLAGLLKGKVDALIVTGAEPRAPILVDEPYWRAFAETVEWAQTETLSAIWSCLAAHAAVFYLDGIQRQRLEEKRSGVFDCCTLSEHPLLAGMPPSFRIPHSRYNDLDPHSLADSGYHVLSRSTEAGIDAFVRSGRSTFLFFQGHPEYAAETLLREYRRDVGRFLRGEMDSFPTLPRNYVSAQVKEKLLRFRERAQSQRCEALLAAFPAVEREIRNTWREAALCIYRNWLNHLSRAKAANLHLEPIGVADWARSEGDGAHPAG